MLHTLQTHLEKKREKKRRKKKKGKIKIKKNKNKKKLTWRDFPSGQQLRLHPPNTGEPRSDPWSGNQILHATIKDPSCCNLD